MAGLGVIGDERESPTKAIQRILRTALFHRDDPRIDQCPGKIRPQRQRPLDRFERSVAEAGGRVLRVDTDLQDVLAAVPGFASAGRVHSAVPDLPAPEAGDPARLDFAVLEGAPAVAESGAVWVVPPDARSRAAAFLAQHLVLVVPRDAIVHELHQAYARIDPAAAAFGCFVAGPSKTADIEQALVIGAHGPRSLHVLLRPPLA